jgi:Zn-dependent peptidase ImmA (M78 family)
MHRQFCEQDRAQLLAAAAKGRTGFRPADVLEDVVEEVLGLSLVTRPLLGPVLGVFRYERNCITLNSLMAQLVRPNTYIEGLMNSTLAHELAHLRLPHHVAQVWEAKQRNAPWDAATEAQREEEANHYAGIFLVPTEDLFVEPLVLQLQASEPTAWTSDDLWQVVLTLARIFRVTGSLMARRLSHLGVVEQTDRILRLAPQDGCRLSVVA